jgi:hypothetical protein
VPRESRLRLTNALPTNCPAILCQYSGPFTIPGLRVPVWFTPTKIGRYQINCAQLCGNGHSAMSGGFLTVESQADFDKWLKSRSGAATSFE